MKTEKLRASDRLLEPTLGKQERRPDDTGNARPGDERRADNARPRGRRNAMF